MEAFQRHYKITFHDIGLLRLALTHRSYLSVSGKGPRESNERLEFLGDSVLGLVTSEHLYRTHPNEHEGQLTKTKSLLVSKAILSRRALAMGLGRFVFMSHSEVESGGRQRLSILADAFESVLGAIYLDQGFEPAREFIHKWLLSEAREIAADKRHTNYKSHLQEYVQSNFRTHPVYRIRSEIGPDHSKQFMVEVMVGRRSMGTGRGRNKKEAEQAAARDALERVSAVPSEASDEISDAPSRAPEPRGVAREADEIEIEERRPRRRRGSRRIPAASTEVEAAGPDREEEATRREPREQPIRREPREEPIRHEPREVEAPTIRLPSYMATHWSTGDEPESEAPEIEPRPERFDEEDEEIGRPEGPLEERHVDPYAMEDAAASAPPPGTSTGPGPVSGPTSFGRSVVGPIRSGAGSAHATPARSEASDPVDGDREEPRDGRDVPPGRPSGSGSFGRRRGRSRR